jgi:hypothetical protein
MKRWQKALVAGLLVVVLSAAVVLLFHREILLFFWHVVPFMGETFTQEKWTAGGSCSGLTDWQCVEKESSCPRGPMVRSLLRNHLLMGTERGAVIALLGEEDGDFHGQPGCLLWSLGMCSGMKIDHDSLFVCFDDAGRLVESGHVQH